MVNTSLRFQAHQVQSTINCVDHVFIDGDAIRIAASNLCRLFIGPNLSSPVNITNLGEYQCFA